VGISGRAWRYFPNLGGDTVCECGWMNDIRDSAEVVPCGRGSRVIIYGDLSRLADAFDDEVSILTGCNDPESRADSRALAAASKRIRASAAERGE